MQLAILGAADHSPEVASRRAYGLAFGSDHGDRGGCLVTFHRLASINPRRSADAELLTEPVGSFDGSVAKISTVRIFGVGREIDGADSGRRVQVAALCR